MIRDARITDPTYVHYAKTNRDLTEDVANNVAVIEYRGNIAALGSSSVSLKTGIYLVGTFQGGVTASLSNAWIVFIANYSNDGCSASKIVDANSCTLTATSTGITVVNTSDTFSINLSITKLNSFDM